MKPDPLASALDAMDDSAAGGARPKVLLLFGDRPLVLDAIRRARRERKLSYRQIAKVLSSDGKSISEGSVKNWLDSEGIA